MRSRQARRKEALHWMLKPAFLKRKSAPSVGVGKGVCRIRKQILRGFHCLWKTQIIVRTLLRLCIFYLDTPDTMDGILPSATLHILLRRTPNVTICGLAGYHRL